MNQCYYDRISKGNRTYRLTVFKEDNDYRLLFEQFEKTPSTEEGKKYSKKKTFEQVIFFENLQDVNISMLPLRPLAIRFIEKLQELKYAL
ncbi:hypothetical protein [Serratia sp. UGAL515B_01]|uniref:hypothetical protein n=1 Tax=Serratia sp. UGAL515B_01 TaxID=2986763 RepID=UPI00295499AB|nr:hypothetical protein [Serratia sp. UGAL515B_01]WON75543.1 hypothetical protein OK023_00060 [Serratia sp. UGAL515B_01]